MHASRIQQTSCRRRACRRLSSPSPAWPLTSQDESRNAQAYGNACMEGTYLKIPGGAGTCWTASCLYKGQAIRRMPAGKVLKCLPGCSPDVAVTYPSA